MESQMVRALLENHFYLQVCLEVKKEWSDFTEMTLTTVRLLHYMQGLEEYKEKVGFGKDYTFFPFVSFWFFFHN